MEYSHDLAADLAGTLNWWVEAGVDCLVQDEAREWLDDKILPGTGRGPAGQSAVVEGTHLATAQPPERGDPSVSAAPSHHGRVDHAPHGQGSSGGRSDPAIVPGRIEDLFPDQLDLLQEWLRTSAALPYAAPTAPRICPAGDPAAGLMILTAMPSTEDCATNILLSGAPGRLFDRMLAAIGQHREKIYLAGLSCLRAPGGRLDRDGAERCAIIARHHIGLAAPKAVLLLGDACAKALLGIGAAQARGRVHRLETQAGAVDAVVTLSPDYLLQQPAAKAMAWADLQLLMERLPPG